ncbi:MAG: 30S ribosomal protein S9 [Thermoplasmata archaeon]
MKAKKRAVVASGKRKTAIARAVVRRGQGRVRINKVPLEIHQPEMARLKIQEALALAGEKVTKVDIDVNVHGGGIMGQADAIRTAVARGLVSFYEDDDLESLLRNYDRTLIVPDIRRKLPKKPLGRGARKMRQKSYR